MPITTLTTPFLRQPRRIFTRSMQDAGYRRLLLALSNHERVKQMSRQQLATYLERMADEEHGWTTRHEVLMAAARALAPELFADEPADDSRDGSAESGL